LTCKEGLVDCEIMTILPGSAPDTAHRKGRILFVVLLVTLLEGCNRPAPVSDSSAAPQAIAYGVPIKFVRGGNSEAFKGFGWSQPEDKFTWSEGSSAELRIPVAPTQSNVVLKMTMAALVKPPELPIQPVEVSVNGEKIAEWQVSETSEFTAPVPPAATKAGRLLTITIKTPKATSPKALGLSADPRILGICCLQVELATR
jgi:hypothetical protein